MSSTSRGLRGDRTTLLAGALMLGAFTLAAQPALATFKSPLNLTNFNPDLQAGSAIPLSLAYTASNERLTISGTNVDGSFTDRSGSVLGGGFLNYDLDVTFLNNGSDLDSGSLTITAASDWTIGVNTGQIMLSGTIYDFGITGSGGSGTFEFLLTGLASDVPDILEWNLDSFGQVIATADNTIIPDASTWLAGDTDFSGTVLSDNSVPVPATLALVGFGLIGLGVARRKTAHRVADCS